MRKCSRCGDKFTGEEIAELMAEREEFSLHPFICPDCFDRLQRLDLEDQLDELIREDECKRMSPPIRRSGEPTEISLNFTIAIRR